MDDDERMRKVLGHKLLSQHEHVIKRPGMYIGSIEPETATRWILDAEMKPVYKQVVYTPGVLKLFDEARHPHAQPTVCSLARRW
jgi:DNA topoisomerase-2